MLKNILKIEGIQNLSKEQQKSIKGGIRVPKDEFCICALVNWGTPQDPGANNGVGMTFSTEYSDGAIPVGWVTIYPVPACCQ